MKRRNHWHLVCEAGSPGIRRRNRNTPRTKNVQASTICPRKIYSIISARFL
jgi:hypothetical protein